MKPLIELLELLGYNLTTLEGDDKLIHFMYEQGHLVMIDLLDDERYQVRINKKNVRYKTIASDMDDVHNIIQHYFR